MRKIMLAIMWGSLSVATGVMAAQTATTKPAGKAPAMSAAAQEEKLEALERKVWDAFKAQDMATCKQVMAPNSCSTDINGVATMEQFEPMMKDYVVDSYTLSDFKLVPLDKDAAVLLYTANLNAKFKGQSLPSGPYYSSTTYVMRGGKWVAMYHQETLAASAMSAAAPADTEKK